MAPRKSWSQEHAAEVLRRWQSLVQKLRYVLFRATQLEALQRAGVALFHRFPYLAGRLGISPLGVPALPPTAAPAGPAAASSPDRPSFVADPDGRYADFGCQGLSVHLIAGSTGDGCPSSACSSAGSSQGSGQGEDGRTANKRGLQLEVNAPEGVPFEGDGFRGQVLFLNRPDPPPDPEDLSWGPHAKRFYKKERRFEFRLQGRFTVDPAEGLYFAAEMDNSVELGPALRLTVNWLMSVVRAISRARGVTFSFNLDLTREADGSVVRQYLAFPMVAADAIVQTPPGETPPLLSEPLEITPLEERLKVNINTTDTFTFAYWSKYVDFARWEICNMPFGWSTGFAAFIGQRPLNLVAYRLVRKVDGLHAESNKRCFARIVLANRAAREASAAARGSGSVAEEPPKVPMEAVGGGSEAANSMPDWSAGHAAASWHDGEGEPPIADPGADGSAARAGWWFW